MSVLGWILFLITLAGIGIIQYVAVRHAAKIHHVTFWEQLLGEK